MIYFAKCVNQRYDLVEVNLLPDQSHVPEDIRNLPQGFYFILQFSYMTEHEYTRCRIRSIDREVLQCKFHVDLYQLYSQDEDSLAAKLRANLSGRGLPEDVKKTMTNIMVDQTRHIACTTPYPGYKVEAVLVKIGIVRVESKQKKIVAIIIGKDSFVGEDCVFCLQGFSGGEAVVVMPCSHFYHRDCLARWLETAYNCPICRFNFHTILHQ